MKKRKIFLLTLLVAVAIAVTTTIGQSKFLHAAPSVGKETLTMITSLTTHLMSITIPRVVKGKLLALILMLLTQLPKNLGLSCG